MSCTHSTKPIEKNNTFVWKVTDTDSGRFVYIPKREVFEWIRFRMDPLEGHGNRIADAYNKAEDEWGGRYADYLPEEDILSSIKDIYTNFHVLNANGIQVFQPFGTWVLDEACKVLQKTSAGGGRLNLGDGFIVPSKDEWACILDKMFNGGMNFAGAVFTCTPDIIYPRMIIGFLDDAVRANTEVGYPRYNIIANAHSEWKRINTPTPRTTLDNGLVVPSSDEIAKIESGLSAGNDLTNTYTYYGLTEILPPESMRACIEDKIRNTSSTWEDIFNSCGTEGGNKTLYYVAVGLGLLLLFSRRT